MNNMSNLQKDTFNILKSFDKDKYFNPISHHLFITPYILETKNLMNFNLQHINSMMQLVNSKINGCWLDLNNINSFNLKKIDPIEFINLSNSLIKFYQDNIINNKKLLN